MAHHLNTKKAMRQAEKRNRRNRTDKSKMKTAIKAFDAAETAESKTAALKQAQRMIDRASKSNILHKNAAARKKARLARIYNVFVKSQS